MIDYIIVIFGNYDLLDLQIENFQKRFSKEEYNLIVIDNTIDEQKKDYKPDKIIDYFIRLESQNNFDGISHGNAINKGLEYIKSNIVCIMDSDFFILNSSIHTYIKNMFSSGYVAVGTEYNDGKDTEYWRQKNPKSFDNIPVCFCAYYDTTIAKSQSWIITKQELESNKSQGYVEVGWRIRKYLFENKHKTYNWKTDAKNYGLCFFREANNDMMGVHYVAGSHRRWTEKQKQEIQVIINDRKFK